MLPPNPVHLKGALDLAVKCIQHHGKHKHKTVTVLVLKVVNNSDSSGTMRQVSFL